MRRLLFALLPALLFHAVVFWWGRDWARAPAPGPEQRSQSLQLELRAEPVATAMPAVVPAAIPAAVSPTKAASPPPGKSALAAEPATKPAPSAPAKTATGGPPIPQSTGKISPPQELPEPLLPPQPQPGLARARPQTQAQAQAQDQDQTPAQDQLRTPADRPTVRTAPLTASQSPPATGAELASPPDSSPPAGSAQAPPAQTPPPVVSARPLYRKNPPPPYPPAARQRQYQGTVLLEVLVDEQGRVAELTVARSSGHPLLDRAALDGVRNWLFEPGQLNGEKIATRVQIPIRFLLQ